MKKTTKSILAKSLAIALAFSVAGITPNTEADAASKKPTVTKKVSVKVGAKKTIKVTSKKKVKKTTWSLTKAGKKVVSLSKKKAKSVVVKGKKKGSATLTAKVKVGSKTYKLKTKITVNKKGNSNKTSAPDKTQAPVPSSSSAAVTPAPEESKAPATKEVTLYGGKEPVKYTIDETQTYKLDITALNETTYTSPDKHPSLQDSPNYEDGFIDDKEGVASFTSNRDYNSGITFYVNPCRSESDLVEENGNLAFQNGAKDISEYDFLRISLSSENEMNLRTYSTVETAAGFPGASTSETYEGGWLHEADGIWNDSSSYSAGNQVKDDYIERNVYIRISDLMSKGMNPSNLAAVGISPQGTGVDVEISAIEFVKVKYDVPVTGIAVTTNKDVIANGKTANLEAAITPENATRKIVKWTSSDEKLAKVNYKGVVTAAEEGSGEVTITATATDGSNVTGTIKLTIGESGPVKVVSHDVDLSSKDVVAKGNDGSAAVDVEAQTAEGIQFGKGISMMYVDLSAYLAANKLDLADYDSLKVSFQLKNEDGTDAEASEAGWGKVALAAAANLNGYDGGVKAGWLTAPYVKETKEVSFKEVDKADLATVAGFNFQVEKTAANQYYVITGITLYKDNNVTMDLADAGIVPTGNNGAASVPAEAQTAEGIQFGKGISMMFVDFSKYLSDKGIDLSDYAGIEVSYQLKNADGTDAEAAEATYGKLAIAAAANLNGYDDGVKKGWLTAPFVKEAKTVEFTDIAVADLATVAGFNLQVEKTGAEQYYVINSIRLIAK